MLLRDLLHWLCFVSPNMSLCVIYEDTFSAPCFHHQPVLQIVDKLCMLVFKDLTSSPNLFSNLSQLVLWILIRLWTRCELESRNQWWHALCGGFVWGSIVDKKLCDGEWGIYLIPIIEGLNIAFSMLWCPSKAIFLSKPPYCCRNDFV